MRLPRGSARAAGSNQRYTRWMDGDSATAVTRGQEQEQVKRITQPRRLRLNGPAGLCRAVAACKEMAPGRRHGPRRLVIEAIMALDDISKESETQDEEDRNSSAEDKSDGDREA